MWCLGVAPHVKQECCLSMFAVAGMSHGLAVRTPRFGGIIIGNYLRE